QASRQQSRKAQRFESSGSLLLGRLDLADLHGQQVGRQLFLEPVDLAGCVEPQRRLRRLGVGGSTHFNIDARLPLRNDNPLRQLQPVRGLELDRNIAVERLQPIGQHAYLRRLPRKERHFLWLRGNGERRRQVQLEGPR